MSIETSVDVVGVAVVDDKHFLLALAVGEVFVVACNHPLNAHGRIVVHAGECRSGVFGLCNGDFCIGVYLLPAVSNIILGNSGGLEIAGAVASLLDRFGVCVYALVLDAYLVVSRTAVFLDSPTEHCGGIVYLDIHLGVEERLLVCGNLSIIRIEGCPLCKIAIGNIEPAWAVCRHDGNIAADRHRIASTSGVSVHSEGVVVDGVYSLVLAVGAVGNHPLKLICAGRAKVGDYSGLAVGAQNVAAIIVVGVGVGGRGFAVSHDALPMTRSTRAEKGGCSNFFLGILAGGVVDLVADDVCLVSTSVYHLAGNDDVVGLVGTFFHIFIVYLAIFIDIESECMCLLNMPIERYSTCNALHVDRIAFRNRTFGGESLFYSSSRVLFSNILIRNVHLDCAIGCPPAFCAIAV